MNSNNNDNIPNDGPPLESYFNEVSGPDHRESMDDDDSAAINTLQGMQAVTVDSLPEPPENIPIEEPAEAYQHPVAAYIQERMEIINREIKQRNPAARDVTLSSSFAKNTQTEWFGDFNATHAGTPETRTQKLFAKTNGFFYKETETIHSALKGFGIKADRLDEMAEQFEMVYFGNTKNRNIPDKGRDVGSKSFVLRLKNPDSPEAPGIIAEVDAARAYQVDRKLKASPTIEVAQAALLQRYADICEQDKQATGKTPFTAAGDVAFLQPTAVRKRLSEIAGINDLFSVVPLQAEQNKEHYFGYSEKMEAYFEDNLKVCKIETKDPSKMPQEKLEQIITDALKNDKGNLAEVSKDALKMRGEAQPATPAAANPEAAAPAAPAATPATPAENPAENPGADEREPVDRKPKQKQWHDNDRNPSSDGDGEKKSIAEIALQAVAGAAKATLQALLVFALKLIKMLLSLVAAVLMLPYSKIFEDTALPIGSATHNKARQNDLNSAAANDAKKEKDLAKSGSDPQADIAEALDGELSLDKVLGPQNSYESELDRKGATGVDVVELAKNELSVLEGEQSDELKKVAAEILNQMTDEQKSHLLNEAKIPVLHKIDNALDAKLAPKSHHSDEFGVLLAKNDKVVDDKAVEYGVLAAQAVAGTLIYTLVREAESGNYEISFEAAENLKLVQHNGVKFDNERNLLDQAQSLLNAKFEKDLDKITPISLLDHDHPTDAALTIAQVSKKLPMYDINSLGVSADPVSIDDLLKDDPKFKDRYSEAPQLHVNESAKTGMPSSGNRHPIFGEMLDINDVVRFELPDGKATVTASVYGAYVHKNDLYYAVRGDDSNYSVKAEQLILTSKGTGSLLHEEIENARLTATGSHAWDGILPKAHKRDFKVIELYPAGSSLNNMQSVEDSSLIGGVVSSAGISPLIEVDGRPSGAYKHLSVKTNDGQRFDYMTLGESIDPKTGLKTAVCVEIQRTLTGWKMNPLTGNRFVQVNPHDNRVTVQQENFNSLSMMISIEQATDIYKLGSMRKEAEIVAEALDRNKAEFFKTFDRHKQLAKEAFLTNEVMTGILAEKAAVVTPSVTIGTKANLASTEVDLSAISEAINNPESRKATPSQTVAAAASTFAAATTGPVAAPSIPSITDFIDTAVRSNPLNAAPAGPQPVVGPQSFVGPQPAIGPQPFVGPQPAIGPQPFVGPQPLVAPQPFVGPQPIVGPQPAPSVQAVDLAEPGEIETGSNMSAVLAQFAQNSPQDRMVRTAMTYVGYDMQGHGEHTKELLDAKNSIRIEQYDAMYDAADIADMLPASLTEYGSPTGIVDFSSMNADTYGEICKAISNDNTLAMKIDLLDEQIGYLKAQTDDHMRGVVDHVSQLASGLDQQGLPLPVLGAMKDVAGSLAKDMTETLDTTTHLQNFINVLAQAKDGMSYAEVMDNLQESTSKAHLDLKGKTDTLQQAFAAKLVENKNEKTNNNELEI